MGRAIDMENDIETLRVKLFKLENIVRGMTHTIEDLEDAVDIIIDEKTSKGKKKNGKEKSNNEGNDASSGKSNSRKANTNTKTSKS